MWIWRWPTWISRSHHLRGLPLWLMTLAQTSNWTAGRCYGSEVGWQPSPGVDWIQTSALVLWGRWSSWFISEFVGLFQFVCLFVRLFARIFVFETHFSPGRATRVRLWRLEQKLFKSKAVCWKVDRDTETVNLGFFNPPGGILETQEPFFRGMF